MVVIRGSEKSYQGRGIEAHPREFIMPLARSSLLSFSSTFTASDAKSTNPSVFRFFALSNAFSPAAKRKVTILRRATTAARDIGPEGGVRGGRGDGGVGRGGIEDDGKWP